MWSRRLQDAVRASTQRALEQDRDEKAAAADQARRQNMLDTLFASQVLPALDRALTEAQVSESLRQGNKSSVNLIVMAGPLKGTTVMIRAVIERMACEVYVYHRACDVQRVAYATSAEEAFGAICDGFIRVLNVATPK